MISGWIDFDLLAAQHIPLPAAADIALPGISLQGLNGCTVQRNATQLICVLGRPHARGAQAQQAIAGNAWLPLLPRLLDAPASLIGEFGGRFALLWIDLEKRKFGLASDRLNTFGFCYSREGSRLAFAERADGVPVARREIDTQALFDYLYFHVIPAPGTIFRGIQRLAPGTCLLSDTTRSLALPWWRVQFTEGQGKDFGTLAQEFRSLIAAAVKRDSSDADTGCFLSGGTDSSTVAGMLSRHASRPVRAYSIGFDAEGYDEMEYARIAARHFGVEHKAYYITPEDLLAGIPQVAAHYDQPFGNSSAVPAYYCARLAREDGLQRLLAGDGGDELFGGNTRYAKQRVFDLYRHVPAALRNLAVEPLLDTRLAQRLPLIRKAASYVAQARTPLPDRTEQYNLLHRLGLARVFNANFLSRIDSDAPLKLQRSVWQAASTPSLVNQMLQFDWRFTLADNDLPKVIGTTGLAGIDVAFPLLDDALIDFSLNLPSDYKLRGFKLRWFFKEALRDFLPQEIITKQKHGFGLPFGPWTLRHAGLNQQAREALGSLGERGILRQDFLRELVDVRLAEHPGYYGEMIWICQMLEHWLRAHAPDFKLS